MFVLSKIDFNVYMVKKIKIKYISYVVFKILE